MSEIYEGVVGMGDPERVRQAFDALRSPLVLKMVRLTEGVYGVYRVASRNEPLDPPAVQEVAEQLSASLGSALAVLYDNQTDYRKAVLYRGGHAERLFDEEDEIWVLLDEEGTPVVDGPRFTRNELKDDEEYDCIRSPIHAGLEALGVAEAVDPERLQAAFCYEELGWEAERLGRGEADT